MNREEHNIKKVPLKTTIRNDLKNALQLKAFKLGCNMNDIIEFWIETKINNKELESLIPRKDD